ncbi:hypothetical protein P691DRAFT_726863 [Macrolepiota fuliginosa MF-IS2]|uniref:Uncharacterized protein n=1 Tax=Macrolepiota fuliginosa MF-IS2 TaxID=1400762 RepID=A0A9P5XIA2_9AGAR|nr:hypothetical protein P691DRAFT_726863 [Macrolepiota fuliginosa MF-IS2]
MYHRNLNSTLVLLTGGIPNSMHTILSVTLFVGAQRFAQHKAIVTRITTAKESVGVTIFCSDKIGTLTINKLTIDRNTIRAYIHCDCSVLMFYQQVNMGNI